MPVLEPLLDVFSFTLPGFHSDNGSEYINKRVAELLEKLRIEFTQSRSRHSNDNAPAGSKNGVVVRRYLGYGPIPQCRVPLINEFNQQYLNPYLNFYRLCFFPETRVDDKGKQRKIYCYEDRMTPYDKLKSWPNAKECLKPDMSSEILDQVAHELSDDQVVDQLQKACQKHFNIIHGQILKTG